MSLENLEVKAKKLVQNAYVANITTSGIPLLERWLCFFKISPPPLLFTAKVISSEVKHIVLLPISILKSSVKFVNQIVHFQFKKALFSALSATKNIGKIAFRYISFFAAYAGIISISLKALSMPKAIHKLTDIKTTHKSFRKALSNSALFSLSLVGSLFLSVWAIGFITLTLKTHQFAEKLI